MTRTIEQERNQALLRWYRTHQRALPWRGSKDPYAVLVSEIMLQQTQAGRVIPYYGDFMRRFPSVADLAAAPFAHVAAAWSGLGYNNRAKRLHQAAQSIADDGWPTTTEGLQELPGVGAYTAHAIAAFAFGHHVAAVDTNLRRVLSRWHGESLTGRRMERAAEVALAEANASDWNQALMDLGSGHCTPRTPVCESCPVSDWCAGPDTYQAPRAQPRFEGSLRQVRGAIVRRLVSGPATFAGVVAIAGAEPEVVADAIDALIADGMVDETADGYDLAD